MAANIEKIPQEKKVSAENYTVPPLVVLITEQDGSPYEWLLRNHEALQQLGYNTVNIELPFDKKLKEFLEIHENAKRMIKRFERPTYKSEDELNQAFMLCGMKHNNTSVSISALLEFLSKDSQLGKDKRKWRYNFIDLSASILGDLLTDMDAIRNRRDKNFAANISQSSNQTKGGTITFLGNNHYKVYDELLLINSVCAKESLFMTMEKLPKFNFKHTGTCPSPEKFNDKCMKSYLQNTIKRKENLQSYFPSKKYLPVDFSNDSEILLTDKIIMRKITLLVQALNPSQVAKIDVNPPAMIFSMPSDQSTPAKLKPALLISDGKDNTPQVAKNAESATQNLDITSSKKKKNKKKKRKP